MSMELSSVHVLAYGFDQKPCLHEKLIKINSVQNDRSLLDFTTHFNLTQKQFKLIYVYMTFIYDVYIRLFI